MIQELFTSGAIWYFWLIFFAVAEGYAVVNDFPGDTLSEHTRKWFRVDTHHGRTVFVLFTAALAGWFIPHIIYRFL